jgi:hypothetical protein
MEDWRSLLRAELAHGGGLERLTEAECLRINEGRSFEGRFDGAADVRPLAWRLPGSKCEIAYVDGDPNLWCRCTTTLPAAVEAVFEGIWEIDSEGMRYDEHVAYRVVARPSVHSVDWMFCVRIVPVLPAFEFHVSVTIACGARRWCKRCGRARSRTLRRRPRFSLKAWRFSARSPLVEASCVH